MRFWNRILAAGTVLILALTPALAQDYPVRPITFVVPYPAGGSTDLLARAVADPCVSGSASR